MSDIKSDQYLKKPGDCYTFFKDEHGYLYRDDGLKHPGERMIRFMDVDNYIREGFACSVTMDYIGRLHRIDSAEYKINKANMKVVEALKELVNALGGTTQYKFVYKAALLFNRLIKKVVKICRKK